MNKKENLPYGLWAANGGDVNTERADGIKMKDRKDRKQASVQDMEICY